MHRTPAEVSLFFRSEKTALLRSAGQRKCRDSTNAGKNLTKITRNHNVTPQQPLSIISQISKREYSKPIELLSLIIGTFGVVHIRVLHKRT